MRGDDLDDLLLDQRLLEERRGREMPRLAVGLGERLVGDLAQQVLEEAVLPVLRRARVGLDAEDLLAGERGEDRLELGLAAASDSDASACFVNVLPSTAASWTTRRSAGGSPSSRAAISACSVSGTSSDSIVPVGR